MDEKLTIAEAVDILKREGYDVTANKLRQYEKQDLLSPDKSPSNYRLYDETDLNEIRRILALISLGLPIKEIKKYLELSNEAWEVFSRILKVESERSELRENEPKKNASDEEFQKYDEKDKPLMGEWLSLMTNKNYLLLSKFFEMNKRIIVFIEDRKKMLSMLRNTLFNDTTREAIEEVLERMRKHIQRG